MRGESLFNPFQCFYTIQCTRALQNNLFSKQDFFKFSADFFATTAAFIAMKNEWPNLRMLVQYLVPDSHKLTSASRICKKCRLGVESGLMVSTNLPTKRAFHAVCFVKHGAKVEEFDTSELAAGQAAEFEYLLKVAPAAAAARGIASPRDSEHMSEPQNEAQQQQLPAIPEQVDDEWEQYKFLRSANTNIERFVQVSKKGKLVELRLGKSNRARDKDTIQQDTYDDEFTARRSFNILRGLWQRLGYDVEVE